jgi:Kef-type K+ transport system membrane component KefB
MPAIRRLPAAAAFAYAAMIGGTIALFLAIRHVGERYSGLPPAASHPPPLASAAPDVLWHLLLALTTVVIAGQALGRVFRQVGQPPVIGQVIAGILLGPSLVGWIAPKAFLYVLPQEVAPFLGVLAQLGVILYMFLVGLELNPELLRGQVRASAWTSHASISLPFVLGSGLALYLYPRFSTSDVPFTHFALFLGVAMSITAFPVLARILADQKMTSTKLGTLALTCAAVDDVTAWCLLAFVVGVVHAAVESAITVAVLTAGFMAVMFAVVRPFFDRLAQSAGSHPAPGVLAIALTSMLGSALATEAIGVHAIFGAFLLGAVIPHDSGLARTLIRSLTDVVTVLILPAFFAFTGMRTEIGLVSGAAEWAVVALIVLVATAGKFGGTAVAARLSGLDWRHAAGLGVLMNTRGLMELIVLNVGLDLGIVSPTLFTMLVLMALVTTVATTPVLRRLFPVGAR